jgi:hypothetical protein
MTKLFLFWVLALSVVQAPFVFSLNCDAVSSQNKDICNSIIQMSNLTDEEKLLLISNLDYSNNLQPDHFMVSSHNNGLTVTSVPQGIQTISKTYIKNAWASIFAFSPSVYYNKSLFIPKDSEVLTGFNYTLEIPRNYSSPGYPTTDGGDCRRTYTILQNIDKNNVFVNNILAGEGKKVRISLSNDSKIVSNYYISFKLKIDHIKWRSYCCKRRNGICTKTCRTCDSSSSETKEESVSILSERFVKYYPNNLFADIIYLKQNANSNEIKLNYSDSVSLKLKSSSFLFYKYAYSLNSSFYPYNVYTIIARDLKQSSLDNLYFTNKYLVVKDLSECYLAGYDFFNKVEKNCSLVNSKINLSIQTNQTYYNLGDKINVSILPKNVYVNLSYANKTYYVKNNILLEANQNYNKIFAYYNEEYSQKIIYVYDSSRFSLIWKIFLTCIALVFIYKLIKKYWRFT